MSDEINFVRDTLHYASSYACEHGEEDGIFHKQAIEAHKQFLEIEARIERLTAENARLREALENLETAVSAYRSIHELRGGGHIETGRAWDEMRRQRNNARAALTPIPGDRE